MVCLKPANRRPRPSHDRDECAALTGRRLAIALSKRHITAMARTHPHAEATYAVVALEDGSFGVEVRIPDTYPTRVSNFANQTEAEAWIAQHKVRVQADTTAQRWFRRPGGPPRPSSG
jgi:hypothetical protein